MSIIIVRHRELRREMLPLLRPIEKELRALLRALPTSCPWRAFHALWELAQGLPYELVLAFMNEYRHRGGSTNEAILRKLDGIYHSCIAIQNGLDLNYLPEGPPESPLLLTGDEFIERAQLEVTARARSLLWNVEGLNLLLS